MEEKRGTTGEALKKLLILQETDGKIFDINAELEDFPLRLKRVEESLESKRSGMKEAEDALKALQVRKNEKETDIETKETKIKKYQADLFGIKNNKEFQSLQQEIGNIKADISVIEDELLFLFDGIEAAKTRFEEEKKKFEQEKMISDKEKAAIKEKEGELTAALTSYEVKRKELSSDIDPIVLGQYQKILNKWGRTAVSLIVGEFCGECNMQLRPQIINEASMGRRIVLCENCSRILYAES